MRALVIAATGMNAQNQNLEVIANNIANINTTAFKRSRAEFTDLLYQAERLQGVANRGANSVVPEGAQIGLGVRTAAIRPLEIQGSMTSTNNQLDLAISGRGWFQVQSPSGETLYTRAGSLSTNAQGQIVNTDGYAIMPNMVVPNNTTAITVSETGIVSATIGGQTNPQQLGQLTLATFVNEPGLMALGSNLFQPTAASGQAVTGVPGDPGIGKIKQGYLEASNVDPVSEIATMIQAQRAYEMNSKVLEAASSMAGTIANLRTS
ncbi:flagellar basal-body rod protein FlgG [Rhodoblastus acidophilus]|uniref:Flagellar basal-body rod protein FlgG n=1 Tax=Rhodoblastus acidophilus TaxID=1074 RepID=A0A6N8DRL5_RHOAC|nr:flagellar basal-body rod protein FlgG [Rhodoblastus acidophilus]MCW2274962.1 flagellar basal-body rod protein FlgG [Rhodoblastus acidophilus]MTV31454.1 flagellar basal-body rod protein FlgG [Rhodoblastus acidophilus]